MQERLEEQRNKSALSHAEPFLGENEEVVHWVRVKHPEVRKEGFAFVTDGRLLIYWHGRSGEDPQVFKWDDVETWGIEKRDSGGPVILVEGKDDVATVHLPARSHRAADRVSEFLHEVARLAPEPKRAPKESSPGNFEVHEAIEVHRDRHTALGYTKRIVITVLGVTLILFGLILGWLPVLPFWLPIIAGLAILASEYDWAKDLYDFLKDKYHDARKKIKSRRRTSESE
ncbi:MAG TPA: PGPGW domain-containing protein [Actinomycetota bacterium]|nr:PGPGW domain-containing protein [Actinomycetota bacterium]